MSGAIVECWEWECYRRLMHKVQTVARHLTYTVQLPTPKNYLTQNVNSTKVEKSSSKAIN